MMDRGFYFRWFIGGIVVLLLVAGACYLWYHYDTAPERKAAADAEAFARQWEKNQKAKPKTTVKQATDGTPAEGDTTSTAEKLTTDTTPAADKTEPSPAETPAQNAETAEVRVSPHGFGPYPEVPEDYPSGVVWNEDSPYANEASLKRFELMDRVLVKLWTEGNKNFRGGSTHNGKVYPHFNNTVYVRFAEYKRGDGKTIRYPARVKSGPHVSYTRTDLLNPPPHLRILDLDTSGIDPHQYLSLPLK